MQFLATSFIVACFIAVGCAFQFNKLNFAHRGEQQMKLQMQSKGSKVASQVAAGFMSILIAGTTLPAASFAGYPGVLDPKAAVMNDETKGSEEVKAGISGLKNLLATFASLKADLAKDSNADLGDRIKKELSYGGVRTVLNKYNVAFDETTQRGTDRLIRLVLQDITELQRETVVKPGKARSDTKSNLVLKRLNAAEKSLMELAAFNPQ